MNTIVSKESWLANATKVDAPMSVEDALAQAHADFNVRGESLYYMTPELRDLIMRDTEMSSSELIKYMRKVDGKQANVRIDNYGCLGVVSDNYGIVQNHDAFSFIDLLCKGNEDNTPIIDSAGVLNDGKRTFVVAHFPQEILVNGNNDDKVQMNVVITNSHDGSGAVNVAVTPVRIICQNMLNYAFKQASGKISFRHTANVNQRMDLFNKENAEMVYKTLNIYDTYKKYFEESLAQLAKIKMTDKDIEKTLVKSLFADNVWKAYEKSDFNLNSEDISTRAKNVIYGVFDAIESGVGQEKLESGNGLWVVNGLTTYFQNSQTWKDNEQKLNATLDGSVQKKLQSTYDNIVRLAS